MGEQSRRIIVIGGGLLGLATALELSTRRKDLAIVLVEKEGRVGSHQSGHNSGVLHAGVYYKPGTLKARLCVEGKSLMERFADEHGIGRQACGKLIVATDESELSRLDELFHRGRANGVPGLRIVDAHEMAEIEPHVAGIRALHSPGTGIIDFHGAAVRMAELLTERGVEVLTGRVVTGLRQVADATIVETSQGDLTGAAVIACAGLQADRIASMDSDPPVRIVPFRGDYYTLRPSARALCRGLIYPVPDPALPFLGVHFTRRFDGEVWAGPNAVLATAREGYRRTDFKGSDVREMLAYSGLHRLALKYWRTGAHEVWRDLNKATFLRSLQRYVPAVSADDLSFGPSGVRAQALATDGALVDDFVLHRGPRSLHVLNAPSPAATASLAIATRIVDEAADLLPAPRSAGTR